jgi:hypothetical protein
MNELVTVDSILEWFKNNIETRQVIPMTSYLDAATKLNILKESVDNGIIEFNSFLAQTKVDFIEQGDSVAKAKAKIEAMEEYRQLKQLEAKKERVEEFIRIIKVRARQQDW